MPGATAPTPASYSGLIDIAVAQKFMRTTWENTNRVQVMLERLKQNGRVSFDGSGKFVEWTARVGEFDADYRADLAGRSFARNNHYVPYAAGYSFLDMTAALSERDLMFASSEEAIVPLRERLLTQMGEDFSKAYSRRLLRENGGSNTVMGVTAYAGGLQPLNGLPTIFQHGSGTAQNYNPDTQATSGNVAASDKEVLPNGTYCGVSTHPTNSISGVANKVNESTSPVIANWSCTGWNSTATNTWLANCLDVVSHLITRTNRGNTPEERADLCLMTRGMFGDFRAKVRASTSQQVILMDDRPRAPDAGMYPRLYAPFEGVDATFDVDMPTNVCYVLNTKKGELKVFPQQPAGTGGPLQGNPTEMFKIAQAGDIDQGAYKIVATIASQIWFNPRYQGAAYNFA